MQARIRWITISSICLILLLINSSTAQSDSLYEVLIQKKDLINENLAGVKEKYPILYSLCGNQNITVNADSQIIGIVLSNGTIEDVIPHELEKTTLDIFTDVETIENIKSTEDFLDAWSKGKIKVIFRNPVSDHPVASAAGLAGGMFIFGFFYYFTGNFYTTKKFLLGVFPMIGMIKRDKGPGADSEISTGRMLFKILGWEGKGYKPEKNYSRLLIGHSYLLKCTFTPLNVSKQVKLKLRYDETKLKIDCSEYTAELPESKTFLISTRAEGLPEMQLEATDFILIDAKWEDGVEEEGIIKIPIIINRNVWDGISYTAGNAIQWAGGIIIAVVGIANLINPLVQFIITKLIT